MSMATPSVAAGFDPASVHGLERSLYRMNVEQYERLVRMGFLDDEPIELIDGLLVKKMGKNPPHSWAVESLREQLAKLLPGQLSFRQEQPVRLSELSEPEPDLVIVRGSNNDYQTRHPGPPEIGLLIEVADTTLKTDRGAKLLAYACAGVGVYWILNLVDQQLEVYGKPSPAGYLERGVYGAEKRVKVIIDTRELGSIEVATILPKGMLGEA